MAGPRQWSPDGLHVVVFGFNQQGPFLVSLIS
jgi:hypothetical protein